MRWGGVGALATRDPRICAPLPPEDNQLLLPWELSGTQKPTPKQGPAGGGGAGGLLVGKLRSAGPALPSVSGRACGGRLGV